MTPTFSHMHTLIKQYAELTRISNLPTCWTNVLTGSVIGSITASSPLTILPVVVLLVIISLFYMAGMALNDLVDLKIDRQQRPGRPIASGRISPRVALVFIILPFAIAMSLLLICFPHCIYLGVLLAAMIILYDITHKLSWYSVVFMALCRALIYIISAYAVFGTRAKEFQADIAIASAVLALYISFVTLIARSENKQQIDKRRWLSVAIMLLVPAPFAISFPTTIYPCVVAVTLLIILSKAAIFAFSDPPRIKQAVLIWLACICLLDCLFLAVLASPIPAAAAGLCFVATTLSHRRIGGT